MSKKYRNLVQIPYVKYDDRKYKHLNKEIVDLEWRYRKKIISLFYNLKTSREEVMFYLEPLLTQLSLADALSEGRLSINAYKAARDKYYSKIGPNKLSPYQIWDYSNGEATEGYQLLKLPQSEFKSKLKQVPATVRYYVLPAAMSELSYYIVDHDPSLNNRPELEDANWLSDRSFLQRTKETTSKAKLVLKSILHDYNIKLEEIPKTIGE